MLSSSTCSFPVSFFSSFFPLFSPQEPVLIILLVPTIKLVYQQSNTHTGFQYIRVYMRVYMHTKFYQSSHFSCSNSIFIVISKLILTDFSSHLSLSSYILRISFFIYRHISLFLRSHFFSK